MHKKFRQLVEGIALVGLLTAGQAAWAGISVSPVDNPTSFDYFNPLFGGLDPDIGSQDGWQPGPVVLFDSNDTNSTDETWDKILENPSIGEAPTGEQYLLYERLTTNDTVADDPWLGWSMELTTPGWAWVDGSGVIEVLVGSNWEEIAGPNEGTASITGDVYDFLFDLTNTTGPVTAIGAGASSDLRIRAEIEWVGGVPYSDANIGVSQGLGTEGGDGGDGGNGKVPVPATLPLLLGGLAGMGYVRRRRAPRG
ncbi:MAG: VPLPA-CTERM sorting domain-containing protein [Chromatiales bacterium]|jgi:hypothetical protein